MKTPVQIMTEIEDWVEYPPLKVSEGFAELILDALDHEGWALVPKNQTDYGGWRP